ncbi:MAG TPA: hypothetical protein PL133_09700 [Methylophilaceae bacterium]|nr:hypothetical protein [Methylophilaceae bacterium]HQC28325.1 hypothetical protein [Methylotenera sp.]
MKPLNLTFRPSRILLCILIAAALFFIAMMFVVPASWRYWSAFRWILTSLIMLATIYFIAKNALLSLPWSYVGLSVDSKNQLQLLRKDGVRLDVLVLPGTTVTAFLTVVHCQAKLPTLLQKILTFKVLILPDMLNAEDYRLLRIWLRWAKIVQQ